MRIFAVILATIVSCLAQADEESAFQQHLSEIKSRMKVERRDNGENGTLFKVWINPPEKPSFDAKKFEGLSQFAQAVDVPCREVEIGLNSYGPSGVKDLSLTLGVHRVDPTGGIFLEFNLPKSHSGHENGLPFLVLICSKIHKADGKFIDWIPTPLSLMGRADLKGQKPAGNGEITK